MLVDFLNKVTTVCFFSAMPSFLCETRNKGHRGSWNQKSCLVILKDLTKTKKCKNCKKNIVPDSSNIMQNSTILLENVSSIAKNVLFSAKICH